MEWIRREEEKMSFWRHEAADPAREFRNYSLTLISFFIIQHKIEKSTEIEFLEYKLSF